MINRTTQVLLLILGLGLVLWFSTRPAIEVQSFQYELGPARVLVGRYYLPQSGAAPFPTVVLLHGISSQKETMQPLATELANHGMAAVTVDLGGHGESYQRPLSEAENQADLAGLMAWVAKQPLFDPQRLGIAGHSMGGTTALNYGLSHPHLRATALLGIGGQGTPNSPNNFMVGIGAYEQLNPVPDTQTLFASALSPTSDFAQGTARNFVVVGTSEHANAPFDAALLAETVSWFQQAFGLPLAEVNVQAQWQIVGSVLVFIAVVGLGSMVYGWLIRKINYKIPLVLLLGAYGIAEAFGIQSGYGLILIVPMVLLAHYVKRDPARHLKVIVLYGVVLYVAYGLSLLLHALATGSLGKVPLAILGFPVLLAYSPFGISFNLFYFVLHKLNNGQLQVYGWVGLIVLGVAELTRPGVILYQMDRLMVWIIHLIRQPLQLRWQRPSTITLIMLPIALLVLGFLLWEQWRSGVLNGNLLTFGAHILGFFVVLPLGLTLWLLRSSWLMGIEATLEGS